MINIIAILCAILPAVASASPRELPRSELSLGGIPIDWTQSQVREVLGKPRSSTAELDFLNLHLRYPHVTVSFSGDIVSGLSSNSPKGCTPAGLCPGDSLKRAKALYGEPELVKRETGTYWEYYADYPCWLQIAPREDRVGSISVACQP